MRLDLLRHGVSQPSHPEGDALRDLTHEGAEAIRVLGERLAIEGWRPDLAYSSPLVRARHTLAIVLRAAGVSMATHVCEELEPDRDPRDVAPALEALARGARHVLLVGHQPLLGRLAGHWTGAAVSFRPGELVALEFDSVPGRGTAALADRIEPH